MNRRSRPIPLAAWIASRNPVLRARAETALYHYGPDAGDALFHAAESVSRYITIWRKALALPPILLMNACFIWLVDLITKANLILFLSGSSIFMIVRLIYIAVDDLYWRRKRLKVLGLALVKRDDLRGVGPLLEAWRPLSFSGRQVHDDEIEMELTRVLPMYLSQQSIDLRSYKKRILRKKIRRLFPYSATRRQVESRGQFTETRSDLIVTLIQLLASYNSESDQALLEHIGRMSTAGTHYIFERNAVFIRDAALAFSAAAPPAIESATLLSRLSAPVPSGQSPQIQAVAKRS